MNRRGFLLGAVAAPFVPAFAKAAPINPDMMPGGKLASYAGRLPAGSPVSLRRVDAQTWMIEVIGAGAAMPSSRYTFAGRLTSKDPHSLTFSLDKVDVREPAV